MESSNPNRGIKWIRFANAAMALAITGAFGLLLLSSLNCASPFAPEPLKPLKAEDSLVVVKILDANGLTWEEVRPLVREGLDGDAEYLYLHSQALDTMPADLGRLTRLRVLDLSGCDLGSLPPEIDKLTQLEDLDLGRNHLASLPDGLRGGKLTRLILNNNRMAFLPLNMDVTQIEVLDLDSNRFTSLPPDLNSLGNLRELRMNGNLLDSLPSNLSDLVSLISLDVAGNRLKSLPPSMMTLRFRFLDVGGNRLCFPGAGQPDSSNGKMALWLDATDRDWRQSQVCP